MECCCWIYIGENVGQESGTTSKRADNIKPFRALHSPTELSYHDSDRILLYFVFSSLLFRIFWCENFTATGTNRDISYE